MTREELRAFLRALRPEPGEIVFVARRGDMYEVHHGDGAIVAGTTGDLPEAWIYYSGSWPADSEEAWKAFFEDFLAEMESMANGDDRCRWPIDEPWPRGH